MVADDRLQLIRIKIERAYEHLAELETAVLSLGNAAFYTVNLNLQGEAQKPSLDFAPLIIYPPELPAIAGDVIHNLRSALDHLALHLVSVGRQARTQRWEDVQFPIVHSHEAYEKGKARRLEGATREAIEAIDRLKPYKGGNEPLWLLSRLDNADKHSFILPLGQNVIVGGIPLYATEPFFTSLGTPIDAHKADSAVSEPALGETNALLPTLHQLAALVSNIVTSFRPFLSSERDEAL